MTPDKSLQAIPTNGIGTFSGLDGMQPTGPELRKFSRASAFGIPLRGLTSLARRGGIERDPLVGFEKGDQVDGGLFQAQTDTSLGLLLTQLEQPFPKGFGRGVDDHRAALAGGSGDEV